MLDEQIQLINELLQKKDYNKALAALYTYLKTDPDDQQVIYYVGVALFHSAKYDEAIACLEKTNGNEYKEIYLLLCFARRALRNKQSNIWIYHTKELTEKYIKLPNNPLIDIAVSNLNFFLADYYSQVGNNEEAIKCYRTILDSTHFADILKRHPDFIEKITARVSYLTQHTEEKSFTAEKDPMEMTNEASETENLDNSKSRPYSTRRQPALKELIFKRALTLYEQGNYPEAKLRFDRIASLDKNAKKYSQECEKKMQAHVDNVIQETMADNLHEKQFKKAVKARANQPDEALKICENLMACGFDYPRVKYLNGLILSDIKKYEESTKILTSILESDLDPNFIWAALLIIIQNYFELNEYQLGYNFISSYIEKHKERWDAEKLNILYLRLAVLCNKIKKLDEGGKLLTDVLINSSEKTSKKTALEQLIQEQLNPSIADYLERQIASGSKDIEEYNTLLFYYAAHKDAKTIIDFCLKTIKQFVHNPNVDLGSIYFHSSATHFSEGEFDTAIEHAVNSLKCSIDTKMKTRLRQNICICYAELKKFASNDRAYISDFLKYSESKSGVYYYLAMYNSDQAYLLEPKSSRITLRLAYNQLMFAKKHCKDEDLSKRIDEKLAEINIRLGLIKHFSYSFWHDGMYESIEDDTLNEVDQHIIDAFQHVFFS